MFRSWSGMRRGRCGPTAVGRETEMAEGMLSGMGGGVGGEVMLDVGRTGPGSCTEKQSTHRKKQIYVIPTSSPLLLLQSAAVITRHLPLTSPLAAHLHVYQNCL